ncbi:phage holin family protein [Fodinicola acaciae]|uniref:phage holin family protein n=1 Tax=Fodinicola acaciae TaxID=2681555 RepID=UPI0013CFE1E2|nr:phage holin family protein [Fodinicola acaciae]
MVQSLDMRPDPADERSTGELVSQLSSQVSELVRAELKLAQLELAAKAKKLGTGAGLFAGAGVIAFYSFGVLLAAAVLALSLVLPGWAAALIVFGAMMIVAAILVLVGIRLVKRGSPPVPKQAIEGLKTDVGILKNLKERSGP